MGIGFVELMADSFSGNRVFKRIFSSAITCAAVIR
jgi:hypothetical protein